MSFEEFCQQVQEEPTQGLGFAYNYACAMIQAMEDSFCEEPLQYTVKNGGCSVSFHTDYTEINREQLPRVLDAMSKASSLSITRDQDGFVWSVVFRV